MSPVELLLVIAWLALTGAGIVLTGVMLVLSRSDLTFLTTEGVNGDFQKITRLSMWQEGRRFGVKLILFLIGLQAFFVKPAPPPHGEQWIGVGLLFTMVVLLNYSSWAALRFRRSFVRRTEKGEKTDA